MGGVSDNGGKVRGEEKARVDLPQVAVESGEDLSFSAFSLTHAGCGQNGVIELRTGERSLLVWCPSCAAVETFVSPDE
jgi:hypothetical protein